MRVWLKQMGVTEVAMESTGVYWKPVWNVVEGHGFRLVLANPQQVKALHGRKSDKRDSRRIAESLVMPERLDSSFVPLAEIRELRMRLEIRVDRVVPTQGHRDRLPRPGDRVKLDVRPGRLKARPPTDSLPTWPT